LLTSLKRFLINDWNRAHRQKRGGGCSVISLDAAATETPVAREPADDHSPDKAFDRQWAEVLLARVLDQLEIELGESGARVFEALKPLLTMTQDPGSYASVGDRLGMSEANVRVTVHRLRRRYRELLREEVGRTLADPAMVKQEMQELFAALAS
jgi:RNA polymerase sigma-70 factor (ECF subfamily)